MKTEEADRLLGENSIDVQSVDTDKSGLDVDTATDIAEKIFSDLPLHVSFAKAAHIESEAEMAMRLEGAENFTNDALIRLQPRRNQDDEQEENRSVSRTFIRMVLDQIKRDQERQREEWSRTRSTVAGVTMTGAEWAALSQLMRSDSEFRQKLLDAFMARGMTLDEAEERYGRVAEVAEIAAIPPSQRTDEQNEIIREANADHDFRQDVSEAARMVQANLAPASALNGEFTRSAIGADTAQSSAVQSTAPAPVLTTTGLGM